MFFNDNEILKDEREKFEQRCKTLAEGIVILYKQLAELEPENKEKIEKSREKIEREKNDLLLTQDLGILHLEKMREKYSVWKKLESKLSNKIELRNFIKTIQDAYAEHRNEEELKQDEEAFTKNVTAFLSQTHSSEELQQFSAKIPEFNKNLMVVLKEDVELLYEMASERYEKTKTLQRGPHHEVLINQAIIPLNAAIKKQKVINLASHDENTLKKIKNLKKELSESTKASFFESKATKDFTTQKTSTSTRKSSKTRGSS